MAGGNGNWITAARLCLRPEEQQLANPGLRPASKAVEIDAMGHPEKAVEFVTEWWKLSGDIVTTLSALQRLRQTYPKEYLLSFCPPQEVANRAAALQEICGFLEEISGHTER